MEKTQTEKQQKTETKENVSVQEQPTQQDKKIKLQIKNLSKAYKEDNGKLAIDNVSFDVYDGEFLSILGPSGCGKTTILRILVGLIDADKGQIIKNGEDLTNVKVADRGMGIVFQNYALFENMTVLQNVEYALKIKKETKATARETALDLIKKMHLSDYADKKPVDLSGGQQQRVAIARTLALRPDIILFDEPMSALDASTREELCNEIKRVQKTFKTTIIYITHDQEEAFSLSDRIMVMTTAKIAQIGTPEEILSHPANDYVRKFVCENLSKKAESLTKIMEKAK